LASLNVFGCTVTIRDRSAGSGVAARRFGNGVTLAVYSTSCESLAGLGELVFDQLAALVVAMVRNQA